MRTPKRLYAQERIMYHPELLTCPHCGDLLVMCNSLAWDKTVQRLDRILVGGQPTRALSACDLCRLAYAPAVSRGAAHRPAWLHLWL